MATQQFAEATTRTTFSPAAAEKPLVAGMVSLKDRALSPSMMGAPGVPMCRENVTERVAI
jgi:hypothetical protein